MCPLKAVIECIIPELSFSLKDSYSMSKGAAMSAAPVGSPGPQGASMIPPKMCPLKAVV